MKLKTTFLPLLALAMLSCAAAKPPPDVQSRLDAWIKGQPGGVAIAWVDADGAAFFQSGQFDGEDPRPVTPDTQFEIGSVTNVFTALLLAESERAGKVSRHDAAAKYLLPPADPAQAALAKITLLSLTTHTSGLPRLPANIGKNPAASPDPYAAYDRTALVEGLRAHGPGAVVGSPVSYSNFGVSVLGEALAAAWGTSYADALRTHVLAPLGMNATTVGIAGAPPPTDLAPAHAGAKRVPNWTWQACAPCGGLRCSARELAAFLTACLGGPDAPLHAALAATLQPQRADDDIGGHVALGWMLTDDTDRPIAWHNGATAGSHAFVAFSPKTGAGVAILANVQKGSEGLGFALLGGKPPQPRTTVPNAADYAGRYSFTPDLAFQVVNANGSLFAQAAGQPRLALRPIGADRFAVIGVPAEISFERGPDGKVAALVLHQNGLDQRAPRGEPPPPPPPPKEIALPIEVLREYAGEYPAAPQLALTVTEADGALFVQATGQAKLALFASAKDEFFCKVVNAQISFQRDVAGKVTGLVLHQNGGNLPAKKTP